jgi:CxxC-x17-CxxC domain-containing protein
LAVSLSDKTLTCRDCGLNFVFTVGEQQFYAQKGFQHEPSRCPDCRSINRNTRGAAPARGGRELHEVVCAECGKPAQVPFVPTMGRPVYCSDCFDKVRTARR